MDESIPDFKVWFQNEISFRRLIGSTITTSSIIGLFSLFINFVLRTDFLHPLHWIESGIISHFHLTTYVHLFLIILLSLVMIGCCSYTYSASPKAFLNKWEIIKEICLPLHLALILGYSFIGIFGVWLYLRFTDNDFNRLVISCDNSDNRYGQCLNDHHLVIMFHGAFTGAMYGLGVIIKNFNCVKLPIIQQRTFIQVKFNTFDAIKRSFITVIVQLKYFFALYAIFGTSLCEWIISILHLETSKSLGWTMLLNLISLKLWWYMLITGGSINFMFNIVSLIHNIFQVKRINFTIHSSKDEDIKRSLMLAITRSDCPLAKLLAFWDLSLLTLHSPSRRQDLFRISHPGSNPVYWDVIVKESLNLISSLTDKLNNRFDPENVGSDKKLPEMSLRAPSKIYHDSPFSVEKLRRNPKYAVEASLPPVVENIKSVTTLLSNYFGQLFNNWKKTISNFYIIAYFIKESPVSAANKYFAECQLQILAIESLSHLVVSSLEEDKYGIVQRDLADILKAMINLKKAVNLTLRATGPSNKRISLDPKSITLQETLKRALYRIVCKFENYLSAIGLTSYHCLYLKRFKEFEDY